MNRTTSDTLILLRAKVALYFRLRQCSNREKFLVEYLRNAGWWPATKRWFWTHPIHAPRPVSCARDYELGFLADSIKEEFGIDTIHPSREIRFESWEEIHETYGKLKKR